jgi:carboxylate-amine ligase
VVDPRSYEQLPIRDDILNTLQRIVPNVRMLGSEAMVQHIEHSLVQGNDAGRLRGLRDTLGSLEGVVEQAIVKFRAA